MYNTFKYHVLCTDGKISVRINLLFYLFFTVVPFKFVYWVILPAMTSLSNFLLEAAFNISIASSVFIPLWLFSWCIMDIVFSFVFISCPSLRTCSENLDLPSAYLKFVLCSLNIVLKFLLVLPI